MYRDIATILPRRRNKIVHLALCTLLADMINMLQSRNLVILGTIVSAENLVQDSPIFPSSIVVCSTSCI